MVAVMVDRTAFRRLDESLHEAENALMEWGRQRARDRAPNDLPGQNALYNLMDRDKEWLAASRVDPDAEPEWMPRMVALYTRQTPITQQFMRLRWQHGRTTEQARRSLGMSRRKADDLALMVRKAVRSYVLLAM